MRSHRIKLVAYLAGILCLIPAVQAQEKSEAGWVDISSTLVQKLTADGQKTGYPGETAGVAVDPTSGDAYLIVAGLGIYKSTDTGKTFARVVTLYAVGRVFGGPVFWSINNSTLVGTDTWHFQLGGGVVVRWKRFDLVIEGVPLGEQSIVGGLGFAI